MCFVKLQYSHPVHSRAVAVCLISMTHFKHLQDQLRKTEEEFEDMIQARKTKAKEIKTLVNQCKVGLTFFSSPCAENSCFHNLSFLLLCFFFKEITSLYWFEDSLTLFVNISRKTKTKRFRQALSSWPWSDVLLTLTSLCSKWRSSSSRWRRSRGQTSFYKRFRRR